MQRCPPPEKAISVPGSWLTGKKSSFVRRLAHFTLTFKKIHIGSTPCVFGPAPPTPHDRRGRQDHSGMRRGVRLCLLAVVELFFCYCWRLLATPAQRGPLAIGGHKICRSLA